MRQARNRRPKTVTGSNVVYPKQWHQGRQMLNPVPIDSYKAIDLTATTRPTVIIRGQSIEAHIRQDFVDEMKRKLDWHMLPDNFATILVSSSEIAAAFENYATDLCKMAASIKGSYRQQTLFVADKVTAAAQQITLEASSEPVARSTWFRYSGGTTSSATDRNRDSYQQSWAGHPYRLALNGHAGYLVNGWVQS